MSNKEHSVTADKAALKALRKELAYEREEIHQARLKQHARRGNMASFVGELFGE